MNSQPLDPNTGDSTTGDVTSVAARVAIPPDAPPAIAGLPKAAPTPALPASSPSNGSNGPKSGIRTTQFWLLAGVLVLAAWMVFAGKLDAGWFAALAPVAALVYQAIRENIYHDAATHPDDAFDKFLETVMDRITPDQTQHVPAILSAAMAARGTTGDGLTAKAPGRQGEEIGNRQSAAEALRDIRGAVGIIDNTMAPSSLGGEKPPGSGAGVGPVAALCLLCLFVACLLPGCAQTPYYVSGINGTVDASKDGSHVAGGEVGVTISPNPNYPAPAQGFAK